jgi:hypothetical protein
MIVKGITTEQLNQGLNLVNKLYNGNIRLNDVKSLNKKGNRLRFTLRVNDSKKIGSRHGHQVKNNGEHRLTNSVCFHGHGEFFECLFSINPNCEITSRGKKINQFTGNWEDFSVGSLMNPMMYSWMCTDC